MLLDDPWITYVPLLAAKEDPNCIAVNGQGW